MKKLLLVVLLLSSPALAQTATPSVGSSDHVDHISFAKASGELSVPTKQCGHYSESQLLEKKEQHLAFAVSSGMNPVDFNKAYNEGVQVGANKWKFLEASKQQKFCLQAKMLIEFAKQAK